jgi:hypothetical protein
VRAWGHWLGAAWRLQPQQQLRSVGERKAARQQTSIVLFITQTDHKLMLLLPSLCVGLS